MPNQASAGTRKKTFMMGWGMAEWMLLKVEGRPPQIQPQSRSFIRTSFQNSSLQSAPIKLGRRVRRIEDPAGARRILARSAESF